MLVEAGSSMIAVVLLPTAALPVALQSWWKNQIQRDFDQRIRVTMIQSATTVAPTALA